MFRISANQHLTSSTLSLSNFQNLVLSCPVYTTTEKFENVDFTLKMYQMFSLHTKPEKFDNHWSFYLDLCLRKTWSETHMIIVTSTFSECFPAALKRKAGVFKFLRFEERFRKAPFS